MPRKFVLFCFALFAVPLFAAEQFEVGPAPSWIDRPAVSDASAPAKEIRWGIYALLDDHQVRVGDGATVDFHRRVEKVLSPSGVQNASELPFDFDPSYQSLVLHSITVRRGDRNIDALKPSTIRVIEKESDSDNHLYDGILTAMAFVDDLRPGDVIDYSWSLEGSNTLLGGRYADTYDLTSDVPTRLIRHRLILPGNRQIQFRNTLVDRIPQRERAASAPDQTLASGVRIYTWERRDVAPLVVDRDTPDWFDPYDHVQISELTSWHEVALWADALFHLDPASRVAVRDVAARIRSENPTQSAQIVAAIRFVQDDIRYLGIEMGRNSHEPHQPRFVLDQRWGDCKDKSFLLASLLSELGVEAHPALVNTKMRRSLDSILPSPFAFDHVITEVVAGGRVYWVDPTLSDQGGSLETIETPNDERALVVRSDTAALTPIVTRQNGGTTVELDYHSPSFDGPTMLTVRSTATGSDADTLRADLAARSLEDIAKERINQLAANHPKIAAATPLQVHDDRDHNVIVMTEGYTVNDLWKDGNWTWSAHAIEDHLSVPETILRATPLAFDFPLQITETVRMDLPGNVDVDTGRKTVESAAFRLDSDVERDGSRLIIREALRAKKGAVEPAEIADHLEKVNDVLENSDITVTRNDKPELASMAGFPHVPLTVLGALVALLAAFLIGRKSAALGG